MGLTRDSENEFVWFMWPRCRKRNAYIESNLVDNVDATVEKDTSSVITLYPTANTKTMIHTAISLILLLVNDGRWELSIAATRG